SPRRQGAGEIRVDKAIQNNTILRDDADEDGVLSLKEIGRKKEFTVTLHNTGNKAVCYEFDIYGGFYTQLGEESTTQALPISFYD
ncbi:UNVERIFIED_CONTAM: Fn3-like domain-containing protein, partial [Salmonella enterica subsp. enterica serovar Enteritidis]